MPILSVGGASRLMSEIVPLMNKQENATSLINGFFSNYGMTQRLGRHYHWAHLIQVKD